MSESIAARVDDSTARWLEEVAEQEDTTISKLVATILEQHSRDVGDDEPNSTEVRFNQLEERIMELEQDIQLLARHSEFAEFRIYRLGKLSHDISWNDNELSCPRLPNRDEGNVYPDDSDNSDDYDADLTIENVTIDDLTG
jgi:hypothetical protein